MKPLLLVALLGCLATVFTSPAAPPEKVRWCLKSEQEYQKCLSLAAKAPALSCVGELSKSCIIAIKDGEADAITLEGVEIYTAGLKKYDLHPIIAEDYGTASDTCYFAVAVVKKGSGFGIKDLRGKKSCHAGSGQYLGLEIPMGTLVSMDIFQQEDTGYMNAIGVASEFFQASCVPGTASIQKLCQLCRGDCSKSQREPYYGFSGAFQCLKDGAGDVAFVNHLTVPDSEKDKYELLCKDNTRAPIDSYERCHWARAPGHAVVSRKDPQLAELIWTTLSSLSPSDLFTSVNGKDLMFSDSTKKLVQVPPNTDSFLYLGAEYMRIISSVEKEPRPSTPTSIVWCIVGHDEMTKCNAWFMNSVTRDDSDYILAIDCERADTFDDCLKKIMLKEADAVAVDGGQVYTAGKCGLVPVMVEHYDEAHCNSSLGSPLYPFFSVAVVKKGSGVTWNNLKGKRSCHGGINTSEGWNIPMGLIYNMTNDCDFTKFFSSGCAPGSDPSSPFCTQCVGSGRVWADENKCAANADERYYGYDGAFRCLVEGKGDVAFVKDTTPTENSDGKGPDWARNVNSVDYELICPGKSSPVPVSDFASCNLGRVPGHAVVTRPESRNKVIQILNEQQAKFGNHGSDPTFRMFQSEGRNLLFQDSTKCLHEIPVEKTYEQFLGQDYISAMNSLRQCSKTTPDLEKSCTFYSC